MPTKRKPKAKTVFEVYVSGTWWRWRMTDHRNGRIIGASSEGYTRRRDAVLNLRRVSGRRLPQFSRRNVARVIA